ncbi:hypothetical protein, partial [uncultured Tyzzerella sp.]|uniref:hypothetical protein n=1 Tax=uncultured Tyzzerella sp. TaxID=2321398 RepID=UPI002943BE6B
MNGFNKKFYKTKFILFILVLSILLGVYFDNANINIVNIEKECLDDTIITKVYVDNIPLSINRRKEEFDKVINDLNIKNNYDPKYNYEVRFIKNVFKYNEVQEYYIGIFKYNG